MKSTIYHYTPAPVLASRTASYCTENEGTPAALFGNLVRNTEISRQPEHPRHLEPSDEQIQRHSITVSSIFGHGTSPRFVDYSPNASLAPFEFASSPQDPRDGTRIVLLRPSRRSLSPDS